MGGAAELPQRSSSPLKRRASSMDVDQKLHEKDDVDMVPMPSIEAPDGSHAGRLTPAMMRQEGPKASNLPSIQEQIKTIETLLKASAENQVSEGQSAFLVSRTWLNRAQAFGADSKQTTKEAGEGHPGPVDNSDIILSTFKDANGVNFAKLKPGLGAEHFELFSKDAWDLVLEWYGLAPNQIPVERIAHNTNPDPDGLPNVQYEFYPPVFAIHRVWSAVSPIPIDQELKSRKPPPPIVVHSTSYGYMEFLRKAKLFTHIPLATKVQLWRIPMKLPAAAATSSPEIPALSTPPDSTNEHASSIETTTGIRSWPHLLIESDAFLKLERGLDRELLEINDQTSNPKYNGRMSLGVAGLGADQAVVIEEFVDSTIPVTKYFPKAGGRDKLLGQNGSSSSLVAQARSNNASGRSSPAPSGPLTRGRAPKRSGRAIGTVGLSNLGNTCYMNSALQCVRSVEELTKYFISGEAEKEVNVDNPLGYKGEVARAYGDLLSHLYADPPPTSYTPRMFKQTIGRFVPAFSGYGQQDSQEFVGFLLDSLQEDLSRVKKKPYIEKPDSTDEMIGDPLAIKQLADKVWDITKKRDDSVIADLFTGLYQSTLVCPVCEKISITFDPFTNLTLPLPVANVWTKIVKFYPLNDAPVNITVDIDKNSSVLSLKQFISARVGVPSERMIAGEEYNDKFFKFYDNLSVASEEIGLHDTPVVFEVEAVPTNAAAPKKGGKQKIRSLLAPVENTGDGLAWSNPMADHLAVPVIHRVNPEDSTGRSRRVDRGRVPPPHFIMLTLDEARDIEVIRRKVLEKVLTFTTRSFDEDSDGSDTAENTDPEIITAPASDADSSGDSKVVAKSIEGEEDLVSVDMAAKGSVERRPSTARGRQPLLLKRFKTRRPALLNPQSFLAPELQNLFDFSYFHEGNPLPTGWNDVSDDANLPKLSDRLPKEAASDLDMQSPSNPIDEVESSEDGDVSDQLPQAAFTTMAGDDADDSDDTDLPAVSDMKTRPSAQQPLNNRAAFGSRKKMKPHKVYGRAGNKRRDRQARALQSQQSIAPQAIAPQPYRPYNEIGDSQEDAEDVGDAPLIRLGEGLVVDWYEAALDDVFGALATPNEDRRTYTSPETLEDPLVEAKKKQRQMRRKNGISIDDCLDEFEKQEILSEQDMWFCPRCKEHRRASKKFDLWKTPDILVVHLKRFSSSGWRREKLDILVDFPVTDLDLTTRVIDKEDGKQEIYDLIAVDDHWGGLGGGHYTAFAKNFVDGQWYEYNDTSVSKQSDESRIVTAAAYLLFYRRRSDVPLGGPRFQEILEQYNAQNEDEEVMSDSGEGQRLGQGSSQHGSPSALIGAEATHRPKDRGLASGSGLNFGSSSAYRAGGPDNLPAYPSSTADGTAESGREGTATTSNSMPPLEDAELGPVVKSFRTAELGTVYNSIEDEGIDVDGADSQQQRQTRPGGMTSAVAPTWGWAGVDKGTAQANTEPFADEGVGQDASSDELHNDGHGDDMLLDMSGLTEPDSDYMEPDEPSQPPPLSDAAQVGFEDLQNQIWEHKGQALEGIPVLSVPADMGQDDCASDLVDEIHLKDEDGSSTAAKIGEE